MANSRYVTSLCLSQIIITKRGSYFNVTEAVVVEFIFNYYYYCIVVCSLVNVEMNAVYRSKLIVACHQ